MEMPEKFSNVNFLLSYDEISRFIVLKKPMKVLRNRRPEQTQVCITVS